MVSFACLVVAATAVLLLMLVHHFAVQHASTEARLRLEQLSWQMRDSLDGTLEQAVRDVQLLSAMPDIRATGDAASVRRILENLQRNDPDYAWIGIVRPDGKVFAATGGLLEQRDVKSRSWFHMAQQSAVAEDYHPAILLGGLLPRTTEPWRFVDIAGPIRRPDGSLGGVLALHLSWEWARRLARELLTPAMRAVGAEIMVVRSDGQVLLGPENLFEQRIATDSLRLAREGRTGAVRERWADGRVYLTGYSQTGRSGERTALRWAVLVRQTEEAALAGAHDLERRALWLSVALASVLAAAAALLARRIAAPFKVLCLAVEDMVHAPQPAQPDAVPEPAGLHEAQVLSQALRDLIAGENERRDALARLNAQLEDSVAARTAELQERLTRDMLTGLPNRRALMQALPEAIARAARSNRVCAILFLDMDGFKQINDTRGHEEGDELLCQFGTRILNSIRETDMAARLAGDEFVVVLDQLNDRNDAEAKAQCVLAQLARPFVLRSGSVHVSASIGVALQSPHEVQNAARLLARADHAMVEAKRRGKGRVAVRTAAHDNEPAP
jgi:diguanylate cyclase (GGDEF)-like protein